MRFEDFCLLAETNYPDFKALLSWRVWYEEQHRLGGDQWAPLTREVAAWWAVLQMHHPGYLTLGSVHTGAADVPIVD